MDPLHQWQGLQGFAAGEPVHVCLFYQDEEEKYRTLRTFFEEGFRHNYKNFHVVDGRKRPSHRRRLQSFGIDVRSAERSGQLEILGWEQTYLRPGWFDQHAMIDLVGELLSGAKEQGFPAARLVGDMGWARKDVHGLRNMAEYCARLNEMLSQFNAATICTYDLRQFSALHVVEVLRSHPIAVIGGILHENPYYIRPDELLQESTRHRRARERTPAEGTGRDAS